MVRIKRVLISVSDKTGITEFARQLQKFGAEIISTGGTAKLLKNAGLNVQEISEYTGFPEMLDGRVKTLHPKIHGGLLCLRDSKDHMAQIKKHAIRLIDMVVVNLYPFEATIQKSGITLEDAIENIDIGGPSMLRSAAKNYRFVAVVSDPGDYPQIVGELQKQKGRLGDETLRQLGLKVFQRTSSYDSKIYEYLSNGSAQKHPSDELFPTKLDLSFTKIQNLRYGENPHQRAALYEGDVSTDGSLVHAEKLSGKDLSFNNFLDLNAAWDIVREFDEPAAVVIKHLNPTGAAIASNLETAYVRAWSADKLSAFGGIVGLNRNVDRGTAKKINASGFLECVVAPSYDQAALKLLTQKKNFRVLWVELKKPQQGFDIKSIDGGVVIQEKDLFNLDKHKLNVVTKRKPTKKEWADLLFGWKVVKYVKSNAIVFVKNKQTIGVGMGQVNRVDSVLLCAKRSGKKSNGSVLCSDAFFPKEDSITLAAKAKVKAIIQPGGSIADEQVIKEADRRGIAMVFTGCRHFKH